MVLHVFYLCILLQIVLLGAGVVLASANRVGNLASWNDVEPHFEHIKNACFPMVSKSLKQEENKLKFWNQFIDSLQQVWFTCVIYFLCY
jgi:hypothetical protein